MDPGTWWERRIVQRVRVPRRPSNWSAILLAVAAAAATPVFAYGLGSREQPQPPPPRQFRMLVSWPESDPNSKLLLDLTNDYEKTNPSMKLDFEVVPSDYLKLRVNVDIASADAPDVFSYDSGRTLLDLIDANKVVDIEQAFRALGIFDVLNDAAVRLLKRLVGGRGLYDLPMGWNFEGIWYNKRIFSEYRLSPPTTWAALVSLSQTLKDHGVQPFVVGGKDKWPLTRFINMYVMRKLGIDAMQEAVAGTRRFTDPGFIEAAAAVQSMAEKGFFGSDFNTIDPTTATDRFLQGRAGMIYNGSWMVANLNDPAENHLGDEVGFFNAPTVPGGTGSLSDYSVNAGTILALSRQRYDATTASWVKYVFSRIGDRAMNEYGVLKGYNVDTTPDRLPYYTNMQLDELRKVKGAALWFEAAFDAKTENVAKDDVQLLLSGNMTPAHYFADIQRSTDAYRRSAEE